MEVRFQKLDKNAITPTFGTKNSAGMDLYLLSNTEITIEPHKTVLLHTGIAMEIPEGYVGLVFARSGLATKQDLAPANKVGVIDADYRGEIMIAMHNHGDTPKVLQPGDRVAQLAILPFLAPTLIESDSLSNTDRGVGGFGSTGKN